MRSDGTNAPGKGGSCSRCCLKFAACASSSGQREHQVQHELCQGWNHQLQLRGLSAGGVHLSAGNKSFSRHIVDVLVLWYLEAAVKLNRDRAAATGELLYLLDAPCYPSGTSLNKTP